MIKNSDKFYIPRTIESNKLFGVEREEFMIIFSLIFFSLFIESFIALIFAIIAIYKYFSYKSDKKNFISLLKYLKLYDFIELKAMPKPFVKKIY